MELNEKLSKYFTLGEMIRTSNRKIDNNPPEGIIEQMKIFCVDFLDPLRKEFGSIWINSGFRCKKLNNLIGGAKNSAHTYGCAADLHPLVKKYTVDDLFKWVRDSDLNFDQVIDEHSSTGHWLHLGMLRPNHEKKARKEALIFNDGKYTKA